MIVRTAFNLSLGNCGKFFEKRSSSNCFFGLGVFDKSSTFFTLPVEHTFCEKPGKTDKGETFKIFSQKTWTWNKISIEGLPKTVFYVPSVPFCGKNLRISYEFEFGVKPWAKKIVSAFFPKLVLRVQRAHCGKTWKQFSFQVFTGTLAWTWCKFTSFVVLLDSER